MKSASDSQSPPSRHVHWRWLPSVYFAEGFPYAVITVVSVIFYRRLGLSNAEAVLYTGWLYLPWVIKPLWSPWVDLLKTERWWIVGAQLLVGAGFAGIALTIPADDFVRYSLLLFWLIAFASATHDIAADGFYMLTLSKNDQAWFVGVRNSFYRVAWISGQGLLIMLAGRLEDAEWLGRSVPLAWSLTFMAAGGAFIALSIYHGFALPRPAAGAADGASARSTLVGSAIETFLTFFRRDNIGRLLAFLLFFRFAEAQLSRLTGPFLLDPQADGGLGLSTADVGFAIGVTGVIMLLIGGLAGGILASRNGLAHWLPKMVVAINVPNLVYVFLAYEQPSSLLVVNLSVAVEQFGYGFGFTAYLLFMMRTAEGPHNTAHYAICTGFMALGMMLPGMFSGLIQEALGYQQFFVWVMLATLPSFVVAKLIAKDFANDASRSVP